MGFLPSSVAPVSKANAYSPATFVVAPQGAGYKADYYTDGTADEIEINAAITAANALVNGGLVHIKVGSYTLAAPIVPLSNVKIEGEGWGTIILPTGQNVNAFKNQAPDSAHPTQNIEICNLMIDGTNQTISTPYNPSNGKGIFIQYTKHMRIHDVYAYNTCTTGIGTDFLVDSQIDRCVVDICGRSWTTGNVGGNGIGIGTGAYAVEDWIISNCIVKNAGNCGIMMEDQQLPGGTRSRGMTVSNCYVFGGNVCYQDSGTSGVTFSNCYGTNSTTHVFEVFTGDIGTLATAFNPQDVTLTNCYAANAGASSHGIYVFDAKNDGTLKGIDIRGCTVTGNSIHGINFTNVNHFSAQNNRCYSNGQNGINVTCTNAGSLITYLLISGNQCYNNGTSDGVHDGIRLATTAGSISNFSITGNRCWDDQGTPTQRYGISTGNSVTSGLFDGNVVSGNKTAPMNITATDTHVFGNNPGFNTVSTITGITYTVLVTDKVILANATSNAITVTLPDATVSNSRQSIYIKKTDSSANAVSLATVSAQTIDGSSTQSTTTQNFVWELRSNGTNWFIV